MITPLDKERMSRTATDDGENMEGLTSTEASARLQQYGPNALPEEKTSMLMMFLGQFYGMMPGCIIVCIILSGVAEDFIDLAIIALLLFLNACIGFREELHAQSALAELRGDMTQEIQCKRDGTAISLDITQLVPGDVVQLKGNCW